MIWLLNKVRTFVEWWRDLTGLPRVAYGTKPVVVDWAMISLVVLFWILLIAYDVFLA